jgi:hypothetical protein
MKPVQLNRSIFACAILAVALPFFAGQASALSVGPNWTQTNFDANSGALSFDWDPNSQYDIVDLTPGDGNPIPEVVLFQNDITGVSGAIVGTVYEFTIPNFFDQEPMKKVWITMSGANSGAQGSDIPYVFDIIGSDTLGGPSYPVFGSLISGSKTPTLVQEYWEMFPNPDWETVKLYVPTAFELQRIIIDTQSTAVPIPAAIWLFGSGMLGLVAVARRRPAV